MDLENLNEQQKEAGAQASASFLSWLLSGDVLLRENPYGVGSWVFFDVDMLISSPSAA